MDRILDKTYSKHHKDRNRYGFSFELEERTALISDWVGSGKKIWDAVLQSGLPIIGRESNA
ncbi:MAG: hypothetical protein JRJ02_00865 [Deltaproteobacteria bacterium]|nr:hypothetical protein [Deltaproteobacteria bacterium]MBW1860910.1 hypothetical protein [Deltaproteobacteria bacterium]